MTFIITHWKFFAGAIPALILAYGLHYISASWAESRHKTELANQIKADIEQCNKDKAITTEASHEYQTKITALNNKLSAIRMRKPARCVSVAGTSPGLNGNAEPSVNAGTYGLTSEWLINYAGEAEQYRLQLIELQNFAKKTWEAKGS